ncbi:hypothetical protein B0T14DRAFT_92743 [Immersiella caudata]|uniref:Transmembrane protein n=1 Tax=Immersiella caudata TaxID=314043 RepID=A0AA40C5D2_9PEZI|nr:hypothetical protein B0T14DRAFT_92743 [Immersiella caudata]
MMLVKVVSRRESQMKRSCEAEQLGLDGVLQRASSRLLVVYFSASAPLAVWTCSRAPFCLLPSRPRILACACLLTPLMSYSAIFLSLCLPACIFGLHCVCFRNMVSVPSPQEKCIANAQLRL